MATITLTPGQIEQTIQSLEWAQDFDNLVPSHPYNTRIQRIIDKLKKAQE